MEFMPACRMRIFADLLHDQLGVEVRLKGSHICVAYPPKGHGNPVIYLPNLEFAKEEDVRVLYGFALHEAGHIRYTDQELLRDIPDHLTRWTENAFEDAFIERRLRRDFPGAKDMLRHSHDAGYEVCVKGADKRETLFSKDDAPFIGNPEHVEKVMARIGREAIVRRMTALGLDTADESVGRELAKRLELERFLWLYLYDWREGQDAAIRARYASHPWKPVLDEINAEKSRSTADCLSKANRLIARLDVHPVLPGDFRPIMEARTAESDAHAKRRAAAEAAQALRRAVRERNAKIRERILALPETQALLEASERLAEAKSVAENADRRLQKAQKRVAGLKRAMASADERVGRMQRRLDELKAQLADATAEPERMEIEKAIASISEQIERIEADQERRKQALPDAERELSEAIPARNAAQDVLERAKDREADARERHRDAARAVRSEVKAEYKDLIDMLAADAKAKAEAAKNAEAGREKAMLALKKGDDETDALIAPGIMDEVVREAIERIRGVSVEDELAGLGVSGEGEGKTPTPGARTGEATKPMAALSARAYMPYDRSRDSVVKIGETPQGLEQYVRARKEYAAVIAETTERLRKLYSPVRNRLKTNSDAGRLDPRKAHRIGLALKGAAVDLSRVWKSIDTRKDPKVAVSLLIDCSGSMNGHSYDLAAKAACCLSEVMAGLGIPHEIVGHTTLDCDDMELIPEGVEPDAFSRFTPFRGYVFKAFGENAAPASVFSGIEMRDNLDGEAVIWALKRLASRREKTKICIALSDGTPMCSLSRPEELERHLLVVAKSAEAREREGMFLCGLGIQTARVREFYKNAEVLKDIEGLPKAVLGIVERILGRVGLG